MSATRVRGGSAAAHCAELGHCAQVDQVARLAQAAAQVHQEVGAASYEARPGQPGLELHRLFERLRAVDAEFGHQVHDRTPSRASSSSLMHSGLSGRL